MSLGKVPASLLLLQQLLAQESLRVLLGVGLGYLMIMLITLKRILNVKLIRPFKFVFTCLSSQRSDPRMFQLPQLPEGYCKRCPELARLPSLDEASVFHPTEEGDWVLCRVFFKGTKDENINESTSFTSFDMDNHEATIPKLLPYGGGRNRPLTVPNFSNNSIHQS